jgi:hypothetical protein
MMKKRFVIFNESDSHKTLRRAALKQSSGSESIPCRGLYSSTTETKLHCLMMYSNQFVTLDRPDNALVLRLICIPFKTLNETYIHKLDKKIRRRRCIQHPTIWSYQRPRETPRKSERRQLCHYKHACGMP